MKTRNCIVKTSLLLISILYVGILYANQPLVRNFSRYDYKSGTQNWAITQSNSNEMFFANNQGLLRFDGRKWMTYPIKFGTNVKSVLYDNDLIYASTYNDFGYYTMGEGGEWTYVSLSEKFKINYNGANEIYRIFKGNKMIFFQSENHLYSYNGQKLIEINTGGKIDYADFVHGILIISHQQKGVQFRNGNIFITVPGADLLKGKRVCSILPFQKNQMLFVTNFHGVYKYDGQQISSYKTPIDLFLQQNQVFCAAGDGNNLVFGTVQRGIALLDLQKNTVSYMNSFSGLQNNTILSLFFDRQQNLWLGLDKGIDLVMPHQPVRNLFGTNNLYGSGYTSLLKNNTLYLGTNQGLYATSYPLQNSIQPLSLSLVKGMEGQVWCLTEIDGQIFCGDDRGAFIIRPNSVEQIAGLIGTWNFRQVPGRPDLMVGCSYQGLFLLKKQSGRWLFAGYIQGNFKESGPMFEFDADGKLWFSHWQKGLFHLTFNVDYTKIISVELFDEKKGLPSIRNNTVFRIDNQLIFSSERGFFTFNKKENRMDKNQQWNSLFNAEPSYIRLHQNMNGDVWCVSGGFLALARKNSQKQYEMDSLSFRILQSKVIAGFEHFYSLNQQKVLMGNEDGFSLLDLQSKTVDGNYFKVLITKIEAIKDKNTADGPNKVFGSLTRENEFESDFHSVRFEFSAPEFRNESTVQYSYFLENYDQNWSEFGNENTKEYTKLPKGKYVFHVKARNILEKNVVESTVEFTILPAWYESNLAYAVYVILIVLMILRLLNFISERSKKAAKAMEEQKELEISEQKRVFEADAIEKKREIKELKNQQLQYELRHKSKELATSTMNVIRKNEILLEIIGHLDKVSSDIQNDADKKVLINKIIKMEKNIRENIEVDNNWKRFEENFDLVYENYLKRLGDKYPLLNSSDKKLCAYLKMDLSSKDIAPLMNLSIRSIETSRYRLRKKLDLDRDTNLTEFLQKF